MGDRTLEVARDFKFYMTCKMNNPVFSPEISAKVLLLNFVVTEEGLMDQMLNIVVS
jgi:dynein heavy chain, axonemal